MTTYFPLVNNYSLLPSDPSFSSQTYFAMADSIEPQTVMTIQQLQKEYQQTIETLYGRATKINFQKFQKANNDYLQQIQILQQDLDYIKQRQIERIQQENADFPPDNQNAIYYPLVPREKKNDLLSQYLQMRGNYLTDDVLEGVKKAEILIKNAQTTHKAAIDFFNQYAKSNPKQIYPETLKMICCVHEGKQIGNHESDVGSGSFGNITIVYSSDGQKYAQKKGSYDTIHYEAKILNNFASPFIIKPFFYEDLRPGIQQKKARVESNDETIEKEIEEPDSDKSSSSFALSEEIPTYCTRDKYFDVTGAKFLMEYCENGEIGTFFHKMMDNLISSSYPEATSILKMHLVKWGSQILAGINEIHKKGYIHGDIKPDNILIDKNGDIKLVDLGLCKKIGSKEFSGTKEYSSPETFGRRSQTEATDIWALGVLLYVLIARTYPTCQVGKKTEQPIGLGSFRGFPTLGERGYEYFTLLDDTGKFRKIIERCLVNNPKKRATIKEIIEIWQSPTTYKY